MGIWVLKPRVFPKRIPPIYTKPGYKFGKSYRYPVFPSPGLCPVRHGHPLSHDDATSELGDHGYAPHRGCGCGNDGPRYNSCVIAFGATGCGKSHTIFGSDQESALVDLDPEQHGNRWRWHHHGSIMFHISPNHVSSGSCISESMRLKLYSCFMCPSCF